MTTIDNLQKIISMRGNKSDIESFNGTIEESMIAYATDSSQIGIYTNGAWAWISGGTVTTTSGEVLMQDGIISPPIPIETESGDDWLYQG